MSCHLMGGELLHSYQTQRHFFTYEIWFLYQKKIKRHFCGYILEHRVPLVAQADFALTILLPLPFKSVLIVGLYHQAKISLPPSS